MEAAVSAPAAVDSNRQPDASTDNNRVRDSLGIPGAPRLSASQAVATLVAHKYGGLRVQARPTRGGLSPSHARRVRDLLAANLSGRILLRDLAAACDLSIRQFTRAFRQTMGMAPHQWLLRQRIDRAMDLLVRTTRPLSLVAADSGFADQSHFTRVFKRSVGTTPAEWRRVRRR